MWKGVDGLPYNLNVKNVPTNGGEKNNRRTYCYVPVPSLTTSDKNHTKKGKEMSAMNSSDDKEAGGTYNGGKSGQFNGR